MSHAGGLLTLPAAMRDALGLETGDKVIFELDGDELRFRSAQGALRRIQERLRPYCVEGSLSSEELIAERRAEAEAEER